MDKPTVRRLSSKEKLELWTIDRLINYYRRAELQEYPYRREYFREMIDGLLDARSELTR